MSEMPVFEMALRGWNEAHEAWGVRAAEIPDGWSPSEINPAYVERQVGMIDNTREAVKNFAADSHRAVVEQLRADGGFDSWSVPPSLFRIGLSPGDYVVDFDGVDKTDKVVGSTPLFQHFVEMGEPRRRAALHKLSDVALELDDDVCPGLSDVADLQSANDLLAVQASFDWSNDAKCFGADMENTLMGHAEKVRELSTLDVPVAGRTDPKELAESVIRRCYDMPSDEVEFSDRAEKVALESALAYCDRGELKAAYNYVTDHRVDESFGVTVNPADVEHVFELALDAKPSPDALIVDLDYGMEHSDLTVDPTNEEREFASRLVERFRCPIAITGSVKSPARHRIYVPNADFEIETVRNCHDVFGEIRPGAVRITKGDLDMQMTEQEYDAKYPPNRAVGTDHYKRRVMACSQGEKGYYDAVSKYRAKSTREAFPMERDAKAAHVHATMGAPSTDTDKLLRDRVSLVRAECALAASVVDVRFQGKRPIAQTQASLER